jgi:hypothetical protein
MHPSPQPALTADLLRPVWLPVPARGTSARPTQAADAAGLSPVGLQPCRLLTRRSLVCPAVHILPRSFLSTSPHFCAPAHAPAELRSKTLSHDSKSPCSAGKATYGAAAERASPVTPRNAPNHYLSHNVASCTCQAPMRPPRAPELLYPLALQTLTSGRLQAGPFVPLRRYNASRIGVRPSVTRWRSQPRQTISTSSRLLPPSSSELPCRLFGSPQIIRCFWNSQHNRLDPSSRSCYHIAVACAERDQSVSPQGRG